MSVIDTFFDTTAMLVRGATANATGSDTVTTVTSSLLGTLRPVTEKSSLFLENNMGREWDYPCDVDTDARAGDALYIGSVKYDVLGVAKYVDLEDASDGYLNIRVAKK